MRWLLLPCNPEREAAALSAATAVVTESGVSEQDAGALVRLDQESWRSTGTPSPILKKTVEAYIIAGVEDEGAGGDVARAYFDAHSSISDSVRFDHDKAARLLSHLLLIRGLALEEHCSAAQIALVLERRDPRLPVTWRSIDLLLRRLGVATSLDLGSTKAAFGADHVDEERVFADATLEECIDLVSAVAERVGVGDHFKAALSRLCDDPFGPYLQMLAYQCLIAEHFDHPLEYIYEFNPRGDAASWLFEQFPATMGVSGNPFLNNAKSVDVLDLSWAGSKRAAQAAHANVLAELVSMLSQLGFAARRELASWIRRLIARLIKLEEGAGIEIPDLEPPQIVALMNVVGEGETETRGVIEQRVVDAVCSVAYPAPTWVARGLGDSVNATNISQLKCGDCDFQDAGERTVFAFEPHAGKLTDVYVQGHARTLTKVLASRANEWADNFGDTGDWNVHVSFVAHQIPRSGVLESVSVPGATAEISSVTYSDLLDDVDPSSLATVQAFRDWVREPLNERRTPESVRAKAMSILEG